MLERTLEKKVKRMAEDRGWWCRKFVSPSNRGVPDRVFIRNGRVVFIELKAPGKKPTPLQAKTIRDMQIKGAEVYVVDDYAEAAAILA